MEAIAKYNIDNTTIKFSFLQEIYSFLLLESNIHKTDEDFLRENGIEYLKKVLKEDPLRKEIPLKTRAYPLNTKESVTSNIILTVKNFHEIAESIFNYLNLPKDDGELEWFKCAIQASYIKSNRDINDLYNNLHDCYKKEQCSNMISKHKVLELIHFNNSI